MRFAARSALVVFALATACGTGDAPPPAMPPDPPDPPAYPVGPYGDEIGAVMANLSLTDLEGAPFSLEEYYGSDSEALLIYMAATWCFTCGPEIDWANARVQSEGGALAAAVIVVENHLFEPPGPEDGVAFRDRYGVTFRMLVDADEVSLEYRAFGAIPLNYILRTKDMTIAHRAEGFDPADLDQAIRRVLEEE